MAVVVQLGSGRGSWFCCVVGEWLGLRVLASLRRVGGGSGYSSRVGGGSGYSSFTFGNFIFLRLGVLDFVSCGCHFFYP